MASKTREITITQAQGAFSVLGKSWFAKEDYNFDGLSALRRLLSNERARLLHVIKTQKPTSIYDLAKKLGRNFATVSDDIKLLVRFGLITLVAEKTKNRKRHRPELAADSVVINLKV